MGVVTNVAIDIRRSLFRYTAWDKGPISSPGRFWCDSISMSENTAPNANPDPRVRLAYERTYLAFERTQMGWVRTALSFISFGFAIAKFFEWLREQHPAKQPLLSPRTIGILMIAIGLMSLLLSDLQRRRALKLIAKRMPGPATVARRCHGGINRAARHSRPARCAVPVMNGRVRRSSPAFAVLARASGGGICGAL
jgi:putative membrane protein